LKIKTRTEE